MISRQQAASVVTDRLTYYDGMIRNGWLLPGKKQSIVTLDFMQRVRGGEIYCPRASEVTKPAVCVTPPPKEQLVMKILNATEEYESRGENVAKLQELLGLLMTKKTADTAWLVQVLHMVNENDEVFARDYVYVRPQKVKAQVDIPLIDNSDGFFSGLPKVPNGGKNKGAKRQMRLSKQQKDAMRLQVLEHRQSELSAKIAALRGEAEQAQGSAAGSQAG